MRPSRRDLLRAIAGTSTASVAGCGSGENGDEPATTTGGGGGPTTTSASLVIEVPNQTTDGTHVRVARLYADPSEYGAVWVAVHPVLSGVMTRGSTIGERRFSPGDHRVVEVPLDETVRETRQLVAVIHVDDPPDGQFTHPDGDRILDPLDRSRSDFRLRVSDPPTGTTTTASGATTADGDTTTGTSDDPPENPIVIEDGEWEPRVTEVASGDVVTWINRSDRPHKVNGTTFSQLGATGYANWGFVRHLQPGERVQREFFRIGRYGFYCDRHGQEQFTLDAEVPRRECGAVVVGDAARPDGLPCDDPLPEPDATVTLGPDAFSPAVVSPHHLGEGESALVAFENPTDESHFLHGTEQLSAETLEDFDAATGSYFQSAGIDFEASYNVVEVPPGGVVRKEFWVGDEPGVYFCSEHGALEEAGAVTLYDAEPPADYAGDPDDYPKGATHVEALPSTDVTVTFDGEAFDPRVLEVPVGTVVEWANVVDPPKATPRREGEAPERPHSITSWNHLSGGEREGLTDAQRDLLDQAADGWAEWDRSLPSGESAFFSFPTAGVYPYYSTRVGLEAACGAVVVGDATLDAGLPCG